MAKKRPSFHGKPKGPKQPSAANMLSQVQRMQEDMKAAQASLSDEIIAVTAGGGAITIVITGHQRVQSITIAKDLIDPEDPEMLQDMLVAAVNSAIEQSQTMAAQKMEGITGGIDLGGLGGLLGGM